MLADVTRKKLEHIVRGIVVEGQQDYCTKVRNYLCSGFATSTTVKKDFESRSVVKKEQVSYLKGFAAANHVWLRDIADNYPYLTRGGEAEILLFSSSFLHETIAWLPGG
jgi:hypothetical protein